MKGDNKVALEFLERWKPGGRWVLTAISPDRKGIETRTFDSASLKALSEFLGKYNGQRNLYFHVNPTLKVLSKKADREDMAALDWLHVDVDPRAGEDLQEEQERSLALLTTKLPDGVPKPTVVIFSGGGYQGFWRLNDPFPIDGDLEKAEEAKRWNLQLEILFSADNCHNVDRIMRLPGSVNIPDARKRKKGRVEALAAVVDFNDESYDLGTFTKAPQLQLPTESEGFGGKPEVKISGNVERIEDVSELDQWDVPDRVKIIMAQGTHPDQPKEGDNSRSAWLFDFCCQMARFSVPDDVIFAIITDPEWGIAESVVEQKSNAEKYAIRQIENARLHAIDPNLLELNTKHIVIENIGGKCRVLEEVWDYALERHRLTKQSFDDIRNRYMNRVVKVGEDKDGNPKFRPLGHWWLEHRKRKQAATIVFVPGREVATAYNLWKGFAVESRPGPCDKMLAHIKDNVCQGRDDYYSYLMGWMARTVQQPDTPGEVAIVLRGGRGVGKSIFATIFGSLFGRHYMQVSNSSHLVGNFNSHLRDLVVLFADEAFYANDKRHESILKTLVTEKTMAIEAKGVDVESAPNFIHLIMASNDMHVIPAGGDERRYFVLDVGADHQRDTDYFRDIVSEMDDGGREALLHHLLGYDLTDYHVRNVPTTDALREQKLLSLDPDSEWWYQKLLEGRLLFNGDGWSAQTPKDHLMLDYVDHAKRHHVNRRSSATALGRFLKRVCPGMTTVQRMSEVEVPMDGGWIRKVTKRVRFYNMPTLAQSRTRWEELHGATEWPEDDQHEMTEGRGDTPF